MSKWYDAIERHFNGNVEHTSWNQDGHTYENVTVLLPHNEIQAVMVDGDTQNILVGVDGWTTFCPSDELSHTIIDRIRSHG